MWLLYFKRICFGSSLHVIASLGKKTSREPQAIKRVAAECGSGCARVALSGGFWGRQRQMTSQFFLDRSGVKHDARHSMTFLYGIERENVTFSLSAQVHRWKIA